MSSSRWVIGRDSTAGWSAGICRHCDHTLDETGHGGRASTAGSTQRRMHSEHQNRGSTLPTGA
eukprot:156133-Rhodomonas_salina.1